MEELRLSELEHYKTQRLKAQAFFEQEDDYGSHQPYFLLDGAISPAEYFNSPFKITTILAEPYGYDPEDGIVDLEQGWGTERNKLGWPNIATVIKLSALYWLIEYSRREGKILQYSDMPYLFTSDNPQFEQQHDLLTQTAWVNVKKLPNNQSAANAASVYNHAFKNAEAIEMQLNGLKPDLIIIGHKQAFDGLRHGGVFDGLQNTKLEVQTTSTGKSLIFVPHPSRWSYRVLHDVYTAISQQVLRVS
ncbi:hypothetical protein LRP52_44530 [Photobacterium sp. ZSDE20]|uniref:Uracil-DNA glycosylase-like domain-containing protein n=1 Tax=Photobacterium pectinilyticum TaxID=2906793 RepID=A0ABT1N8P4_9GAMM|nr:hypothetical protein [Photobacterium sp. ZSDE20]MCQ1061105.1 hypothetical protein [Photobacterium sp. ZSDE20]MDD1829237.1 hypothetical protein [Photobacterium sp. ZSDE20]